MCVVSCRELLVRPNGTQMLYDMLCPTPPCSAPVSSYSLVCVCACAVIDSNVQYLLCLIAMCSVCYASHMIFIYALSDVILVHPPTRAGTGTHTAAALCTYAYSVLEAWRHTPFFHARPLVQDSCSAWETSPPLTLPIMQWMLTLFCIVSPPAGVWQFQSLLWLAARPIPLLTPAPGNPQQAPVSSTTATTG